MIYIVLLILALNYNLTIKSVAHISSGMLVIFLYIAYVIYILSMVLITIPNNTLLNIKRVYKYFVGDNKWK